MLNQKTSSDLARNSKKTDEKNTGLELTKPPEISLPKGGGAIRGIGEKFAANPVTGTGSMTIPIATSPGRSGFGPQLSLSYDSGAGNGPFGLGWNLSLPSITRKTDKGLPRYNDHEESDVFILSGAEDLVPVLNPDGSQPVDPLSPSGHKIRRYRPRIEGLFARIERWTNSEGVSHWRSISKDNITTLYGATAESRIVDATDATRIFSWLICESFDDKGNAIRYEYTEENLEGIDRSKAHEANRKDSYRIANRYIKRIKYCNKMPRQADEDLSKRKDWLLEVVFDYGEHYEDDQGSVQTVNYLGDLHPWRIRNDPFSSYRPGFEVRTYRLCQRVLMFHHFEELVEPNYLVRATHFTYNQTTAVSFISSVTQSSYKLIKNKYQQRSLPPVEFEYSEAKIKEIVLEVDPISLENLPQGLDNSRYQWVDLDGEGLSGLLTEQGEAWFYKRNQSAVPIKDSAGNITTPARFAPLELVNPIPSFANLAGGQQLLDLAGDGQLDVVEFDGPAPGFFERTSDEDWEAHRSFSSLPNIAWRDPNLKFIDLTGDGHADILITEDEAFNWYPSLAEAGFGPGEKVRQAIDEEQGPRLVFADGTQSIYLADMSGDGLTDLVRIRNGEVCYWPNLGYARFGAKVTMDQSPWFDAPDMFDQRRIRLADIDGSGLVDILYLTGQGVQIYLNQSGNSWDQQPILSTFPRIDNLSTVSTVDLLGNGTACLVWSSPLHGDARSTIRYIDLMGGQKPHLLIKTKNNLGAETKIDYAPSTKFYLQDKQAGKPWITKLPFPVHCVQKVTVTDKWRRTEFSSTYSYHHGYFDGIEREFRGFGRVEQVDIETYDKFEQGNIASPFITNDKTLYQPPIKTITWYHTGVAIDREHILTQFENEYFAARYSSTFKEKALPEPELPADLNADEWREALRACKGMVLRQESYELDVEEFHAADSKDVPVRIYSAATHNCQIQRLQPQGDNKHAIFLVTKSEALSYQYELELPKGVSTVSPDPRIMHTLNLRYDEYGNPLQSIAIAYGRVASNQNANQPQAGLIDQVQQATHIVYTETRYTDDVILPTAGSGTANPTRHHRLRLPYEVRTYEITGIPKPTNRYFNIGDLRKYDWCEDAFYPLNIPANQQNNLTPLLYHEQPRSNAPHRRKVEHVCTLFFDDGDDITHEPKTPINPLPLGHHGPRGLKYEDYKLALTKPLLQAILGNKFDTSVENLLNTSNKSGYWQGNQLFGNSGADQWWMRSGVAGFADDATDHFYLPEEYIDPFDSKTTLAYDKNYDLFIQSSTDALGNNSGMWVDPETKKPRFDYRVLAPIELVDPNGNRTEVYFDILGMVVAMAVKGKGDGTEGDDLDRLDDNFANPAPAEVQAFCTASDMNEGQARTWLDNATARFVYHFGEDRDKQTGAFSGWEGHLPGACGIVREIHVHATGGDASPLQVSLECSDGSGNVLMKKVQAEPAPGQTELRWIINGLTVVNNKGKPVKQYEPSFSKQGFGCEPPPAEGVTSILYYDAAGRVVRTEMPDGTFSRVEFSPWHVKTFDANDTVLDSRWYQDRGAPNPKAPLASGASPDTRSAWLAAQHANTPSETHLDSLGREVIAIAHNRTPDANGNWLDEKYLTYTKLDAEGKPLWIRDARDNLVMQYITPARSNNASGEDMPANAAPCYDIAGNLLFQHSMDAGDRWMLMDTAGKPMLAWDLNDKGSGSATQQRIYRTDYDELHRPTAQWLTIDIANPALIEAFEYCDTNHPNIATGLVDAKNRNLIGQAIKHWDSSGLATVERIDLSGQPAHITRSLIKLAADNTPDGVLNWNLADRPSLLEDETFIQLTEYDALGRMTTLYNWHRDIKFATNGTQQATPGLTNRVSVYVPEYNRRGVLNSERLHVRASKLIAPNGKPAFNADAARSKQAIVNISYNAKGQKLTLELGNGTTITYSYERETFRLDSLITERSVSPKGVQDLHYTYDPVGNITHINDAAQEVIYFNQSIIRPEHHYIYDALYRLIETTGRENPSAPAPPPNKEGTWPQQAFPASDQPRIYIQHYTYDEVGNFLTMQHSVPTNTAAGWTRRYEPHQDSNRLYRTWYNAPDWDHAASAQRTEYRHDTHGNMLNLNQTPEDWGLDIRWDWRDMIRGFDCIGGGIARYHYSIDKQRTRKHITHNGGGIVEDRIYLGGYELYRRTNPQSEMVEEIESHHLFEGEQRVLLVDDVIKAKSSAQPGPNELRIKEQTLFRYQYSNHLGSACLELDHQAEIISYEEYHPYGTSAYRAMKSGVEAPAKRYRYTGMERDEESGLGYHHNRFYSKNILRWISTDPSGPSDSLNLFLYCKCRPLILVDSNGRESKLFEFIKQSDIKQSDKINKTGLGLGILLGTVAGLAPGGFIATGIAQDAGYFEKLPRDFHAGVGIGESAVGVAEMILGLGAIVGGSIGTEGGIALAPFTDGVSLLASFLGVIAGTAGVIVTAEGALDTFTGVNIFMSAIKRPPDSTRTSTGSRPPQKNKDPRVERKPVTADDPILKTQKGVNAVNKGLIEDAVEESLNKAVKKLHASDPVASVALDEALESSTKLDASFITKLESTVSLGNAKGASEAAKQAGQRASELLNKLENAAGPLEIKQWILGGKNEVVVNDWSLREAAAKVVP